MPIYEYECENCGHTFERLYMAPEERPSKAVCPECDSMDVHRVFSPPTVHSGSAADIIEEAAEQAKGGDAKPRAFDQHDLNKTL